MISILIIILDKRSKLIKILNLTRLIRTGVRIMVKNNYYNNSIKLFGEQPNFIAFVIFRIKFTDPSIISITH